MNKSELIAKAAEKAGTTRKDAEAVVNATLESIIEAVKEGDYVQLIGFGTFERRARKAKMARNPRTGEEIEVPASNAPAFKAGKAFKDAVK